MLRRRPGWMPVFRPETRQNNNLGSGFDSIKTGRTLGVIQIIDPDHIITHQFATDLRFQS